MENARKGTDTLIKDGGKAVGQVLEAAENVWDTGLEKWRALRGQSKDAVQQARKEAQEPWDDAHNFIQHHPAKALGLAFLIGALFGRMVTAVRKDS